MANRSAEAGVPSGARSAASDAGTSSPTSGPMTPPATTPVAGSRPSVGLTNSAQRDADPRSGERGNQLTPARDQPDGQPDHRGREDDVDAETAGLGDRPARVHPGERGEVPWDERRAERADPVAGLVRPPEPPEVRERHGESLVGEEVGHHRAARPRDVGQPRPQGRGVEQVAGIEQEGEQRDRGPGEPRGHVADRRELGGPGEHDRAHHHGLERAEAGLRADNP